MESPFQIPTRFPKSIINQIFLYNGVLFVNVLFHFVIIIYSCHTTLLIIGIVTELLPWLLQCPHLAGST